MTDAQLQVFYDLLGEAYLAGKEHEHATYGNAVDGESAASVLFPLAARMEEAVQKLVEEEREACAMIAQTLMPREMNTWYKDGAGLMGFNIACTDVMSAIRSRSLPSSPERETL